MLENCQRMSNILFKALRDIAGDYEFIKEVRGKGLMIGIELYREGKDIVKRCLEKGLIINCTMDKVLRLLPPLIITQKEVDRALDIFSETIKDFS